MVYNGRAFAFSGSPAATQLLGDGGDDGASGGYAEDTVARRDSGLSL